MFSRAPRAASLAREAVSAFSMIMRPTAGFSSRNCDRRSNTTESTSVRISELPSLAFVCPSNWGFVSLTEMTAVRPSRLSSPEMLSPSLRMPDFLP